MAQSIYKALRAIPIPDYRTCEGLAGLIIDMPTERESKPWLNSSCVQWGLYIYDERHW